MPMKLTEFNAGLVCYPLFVEVGPDVPYPPLDRFRIVKVLYDEKNVRFDVILRELTMGLEIRYREISKNDDGTRVWREVFRDPYTDKWVRGTRIGTYQIRGIEVDCIDIH